MSRVPEILITRLVRRAAECGMTDRQISMMAVGNGEALRNIKNKGSMPSADRLDAIARVLNVTTAWLLGEEDGQMPVAPARILEYAAEKLEAVMLPYYHNIEFSMGSGAYFDEQSAEEMVPFRREWLRGRIAGKTDKLMLLSGRGDSMRPTIDDGDVLLVDRAQTMIQEPDRIWAFGYEEAGYIKRLRMVRGGNLEVSSDNPAVRSWTAPADEIQVVGRVINIMRWQ